MFLVWLALADGPTPVLCDGVEEHPRGYRLHRPRLTLTHGGKRYQPIEYVVPFAMVDSYARVEELGAGEAPASAEVEPPAPALRVVGDDDRPPE